MQRPFFILFEPCVAIAVKMVLFQQRFRKELDVAQLVRKSEFSRIRPGLIAVHENGRIRIVSVILGQGRADQDHFPLRDNGDRHAVFIFQDFQGAVFIFGNRQFFPVPFYFIYNAIFHFGSFS